MELCSTVIGGSADTYAGRLGYELEAVYQSNPNIFGIQFNSQFAEEAFTVYDHPKVMVFKKTADFDLAATADLLYQVDLDKIQSMSPGDAEKYKGDLMLSDAHSTRMQETGTGADLLINRTCKINIPLWVWCCGTDHHLVGLGLLSQRATDLKGWRIKAFRC